MDASSPGIGVALGSGGARGLAHIVYIEALDELGLVPQRIAGTSIGALIGAGWASGMSGAELRAHALQSLGSLQEIAGRLWMTNRPTLKGVLDGGISMQVDARNLVDAFLPAGFPEDFAALQATLSIVATDYHSWETVVFGAGPLRQAIASSLAIPALLRPVRFADRLLIDGGATNPLPIDLVAGSDVVIAIDVNGSPAGTLADPDPNPLDAGFVATQIMTQSIVRNMLTLYAPDIYVHVPVGDVRILEFWRVRELLEQTDLLKDAFKRSVEDCIRLHEVQARTRERPE